MVRFIYDCLTHQSPPQFHLWFSRIINYHEHSTRSNTLIGIDGSEDVFGSNLFIPFARTAYYGQRSIKVLGPKLWNNISHSICSTKSRIVFSKAMKKHFFLDY